MKAACCSIGSIEMGATVSLLGLRCGGTTAVGKCCWLLQILALVREAPLVSWFSTRPCALGQSSVWLFTNRRAATVQIFSEESKQCRHVGHSLKLTSNQS